MKVLLINVYREPQYKWGFGVMRSQLTNVVPAPLTYHYLEGA